MKYDNTNYTDHTTHFIQAIHTIYIKRYLKRSFNFGKCTFRNSQKCFRFRCFDERYLNQSFNDLKRSNRESFYHKNVLIALELSTVARETSLRKPQENCKKQNLRKINPRFRGFDER